MITLASFIVTLAILIAVHEYGHYRMAVACQVRVLRFSIGFGPVIWRRQSHPHSCEFVVSALPLGGYVKMLDEREGPVDPAWVSQAYNRRPLWQRSAIVAAGPLANLLLATVLYAGLSWWGESEPKAVIAQPATSTPAQKAGFRAGDWIQSLRLPDQEWEPVHSLPDLNWKLAKLPPDARSVEFSVADRWGRSVRSVALALEAADASESEWVRGRQLGLSVPFSEPVLGEVKPQGPAFSAGLRAGDRVLRVNEQPIVDAQTLKSLIRAYAVGVGDAPPMRWVVERQGQVTQVDVQPRIHREGNAPAVGRIDAFVGGPAEMVQVQRGLWEGWIHGLYRTWDISWLSLKMLGKMVIGEASLRNLSGPLTIADYAGQSAQSGPLTYIGFLALISVSLGILNLLPLPMLDGGHLMYHLFEGLSGRPVPDVWLERLQKGGIVVLVILMSVALFNDVVRLLGL
mgnify:FL=1